MVAFQLASDNLRKARSQAAAGAAEGRIPRSSDLHTVYEGTEAEAKGAVKGGAGLARPFPTLPSVSDALAKTLKAPAQEQFAS